MKELNLYTTSGCHLCELAEKMLRSVIIHLHRRDPFNHEAIHLSLVEIANDEKLVERYGVRIPVIKFSDADTELSWPFTDEQAFVFLSARLAKG